jgi:hypothetical protein
MSDLDNDRHAITRTKADFEVVEDALQDAKDKAI